MQKGRFHYVALGVGEGFLIPLVALEMRRGGGADANADADAALTVGGCVTTIVVLLPLLVWRGLCLVRQTGDGGTLSCRKVKRDW